MTSTEDTQRAIKELNALVACPLRWCGAQIDDPCRPVSASGLLYVHRERMFASVLTETAIRGPRNETMLVDVESTSPEQGVPVSDTTAENSAAALPSMVETLVSNLGDLGVEHHHDDESSWTVSVPIGHMMAVEADFDISQSQPQFEVTVRSWAADHGLQDEVFLGSLVTASSADAVMRRVVEEQNAADAEIERILSAGQTDE